jgi:hypothetical protein
MKEHMQRDCCFFIRSIELMDWTFLVALLFVQATLRISELIHNPIFLLSVRCDSASRAQALLESLNKWKQTGQFNRWSSRPLLALVKLSIFDVEFRSAWPDSRQCDYKACKAISIFWKFTQTQMTKKSFIEAGNFQFI